MMFVFRCFLLLAVFIFAWYLRLCLYPDLSKASRYWVTESLMISSEEDNDESRDTVYIYAMFITLYNVLRHKNHGADGSEKLSNAERIANSALDQIQVKVDIIYTLKYHYCINLSSLHDTHYTF